MEINSQPGLLKNTTGKKAEGKKTVRKNSGRNEVTSEGFTFPYIAAHNFTITRFIANNFQGKFHKTIMSYAIKVKRPIRTHQNLTLFPTHNKENQKLQ